VFRADKIKRAVADKAFEAFDVSPTVWVRRAWAEGGWWYEIEGELVDSGELYRTVRYKLGNAGTRYFEIRVKEIL